MEGLSTKYGIDVVPTFVYFEDGIPSVYDEESDELDSDPEAIAEWIEEQRTSSTIEEVNQYTYILIESGRCICFRLWCASVVFCSDSLLWSIVGKLTNVKRPRYHARDVNKSIRL